MIYRTMNAAFLNEVANHDDVRPFLGGGAEPLDLGPLLSNPAVVALEVMGDGGWLLQPSLPGVYELHTLFMPHARGKSYFAAAREAMRWMFTNTDCLEIITKCPDDNPGARMAASVMGFRERFRREACWPPEAPAVGVSYRVFSIDDWFTRDKVALLEGRKFHAALEAAKIEAGSALVVHPEDEAHDRAVGAAALMVKAGQLAKAVGFYSRWATFAGYATIEAVGHNLIDVRDAIVEVSGGEMRVLLVRHAPAE